jgi:hypothetical protein
MGVIHYDFEGVKRATSNGSAIANSMESVQDKLVLLRKKLNILENHFHGKGYKSTLFKNYDELYSDIGSGGSGFWNTISTTRSSLDYLYNAACTDKRLWDEEQERLRREREERERREREERERREREKQGK